MNVEVQKEVFVALSGFDTAVVAEVVVGKSAANAENMSVESRLSMSAEEETWPMIG